MTDAPRTYSWGPSFTAGGGTLFRIWSPADRAIRLRIAGDTLPMNAADDGWFEIELGSRPIGEPYGFVLADGSFVPDPASRRQGEGVLGASTLIDMQAYRWRHADWRGRPWEQAIIYELHIGAFTGEGTFRAATERLAYLAETGFTAIEIMPVAHFPGQRGWGYDGVFPYAPHSAYGIADDLKALVDAAHGLGLMVFLDVVYNHFGPLGNFLQTYAPAFFRQDDPTPWGARIAFEQPPVRRFFIENALYWLDEYRLDGLRLDAVDQIDDPSELHVLEELSNAVRASAWDRHVHLFVENPANGTDLIAARPDMPLFRADWNDDFHHALHVAATGEGGNHYAPFADDPWNKVRSALAKGYIRDSRRILDGEPVSSSSLPPSRFVHFLQNHDQVGNRARGDRLHEGLEPELYRALMELLILSPQIPLLFMGEDHLSHRPFRFFADYEGEERQKVWDNRTNEALNFGGFPDGFGPEDIPDPSEPRTFQESKLDWSDLLRPEARQWRDFLRQLFAVRARHVIPVLPSILHGGKIIEAPERCLFVDWQHANGILQLRANLSPEPAAGTGVGCNIYPGRGFDPAVLPGYVVALFNENDRDKR
jgi:malto-oligosyltrehalose trehalohydrolase